MAQPDRAGGCVGDPEGGPGVESGDGVGAGGTGAGGAGFDEGAEHVGGGGVQPGVGGERGECVPVCEGPVLEGAGGGGLERGGSGFSAGVFGVWAVAGDGECVGFYGGG